MSKPQVFRCQICGGIPWDECGHTPRIDAAPVPAPEPRQVKVFSKRDGKEHEIGEITVNLHKPAASPEPPSATNPSIAKKIRTEKMGRFEIEYDKPAAAPTGTGEGSELERQLAICEQNGSRWIQVEVSAIRALCSQLEEARDTNRELNRRNGELQRSLNLESGRKSWYGYWHAAFELFGSAMRQKEAAERDLATAQARIARLEEALWTIEGHCCYGCAADYTAREALDEPQSGDK